MVTVQLFARLKDLAGKETLTFSVEKPVPLKQFIETLSSHLPTVVPLVKEKRVLVAVNQEAAVGETLIRDGDEIALMPPFSGGSPSGSSRNPKTHPAPWTGIQNEDFSVNDAIVQVKAVSKRVGGIAVFLGTARDFSENHPVKKLRFEHYRGMAEQKLAQIREEGRRRYEIIEMMIIHRTGEIPAGENIVLIVVGAEHRDEAFRACRWAIDELKATVPIWKKELGEYGKTWVEPHP